MAGPLQRWGDAEAVLAQIDTMKKAILARAFRGELESVGNPAMARFRPLTGHVPLAYVRFWKYMNKKAKHVESPQFLDFATLQVYC